MATAELEYDHPQAAVFGALIDPTTYPDWLVGAQAMRAVDDDWPRPGSSFHHRVGLGGPLTIDDSSTVRSVDQPDQLELEVRARPLGRAVVTFELHSAGGQAPTTVRFSEEPIGMARVLAPLLAPVTVARNKRSLQRLAELLDGGPSAA